MMPSRKNLSDLISFLEILPVSNCITNPINLSYEVAYLSKHRLLYNPPGFGYSLRNYTRDLNLYNELYDKYPLISKNISALANKYNLDYLIQKKKYDYKSYSSMRDLTDEYELNSFIRVYENEDFILFKLK